MNDHNGRRVTGAPIYLVVVACVLAAFGISWVLRDQQTRLVFVLAIVGAAAVGGYRAGLLAAVLSTVLGAIFLTPAETRSQFFIAEVIRFVCFVSVALVVAWISRARQQIEASLRKTTAELDQRVTERTLDLQKLNSELELREANRQKAEQALRESESRYRELVTLSPDAIYIVANEKIVFSNGAAATLLGATDPNQLIGLSVAEVAAPQYMEMVKQRMVLLAADQSVPRVEEVFVRRDGSQIDVEVACTNVSWNGERAILVIAREISERKRVEAELRTVVRNARCILYQTIVEGLEGWEKDFEGAKRRYVRTLRVLDEEAAQQVLPLDVAPGESFWSKWAPNRHPSDLPKMAAISARAFINGEDSFEQDYRCFDRDGNIVWLHEVCSIEKLAANRWRVTGVCTDVTEQRRAQEASARLAAIVASSDEAIIGSDLDGRIQTWNKSAERMFGYLADEVVGRARQMLIPEQAPGAEALLHTPAGRVESMRRRKNGQLFDVRVALSPVKDAAGNVIGIAEIVSDITEQKRAEQSVQFQKAVLESVIEASPDGVLVVSPDGKWLTFNKRFQSIWLIPDQMASQAHPDDGEVLAWVSGQLEDPDRFRARVEYLYQHPDEVTLNDAIAFKDGRTIHRSSAPIRGPDNVKYGRVWFFEDVTAHIEDRNRLQTMTSELVLAEERERRRMAITLHDYVGQLLALLRMKLEALTEDVPKTLTSQSAELVALVQKAIDRTRTLTVELSPPVLYEAGFEAAVEWLAGEVERTVGLPVRVSSDRLAKYLTQEMSVLLFQSIRELLNNTVKHAKAHEAEVSLRVRSRHLRVRVWDDGVGLNEEKVRLAANRNSFGLFSIRERLKHVGGHLKYRSHANRGTIVTLIVPIVAAKTSEAKAAVKAE